MKGSANFPNESGLCTPAFRAGDELDTAIRSIVERYLRLATREADDSISSETSSFAKPRRSRGISFRSAFPHLRAENLEAAKACAAEIFELLRVTPSARDGRTVLDYMTLVAKKEYCARMAVLVAPVDVEKPEVDEPEFASVVFQGVHVALWRFDLTRRKTSFVTFLYRAVKMVARNLARERLREARQLARLHRMGLGDERDEDEPGVIPEEILLVPEEGDTAPGIRSVLPLSLREASG